MLIKEIDEYGGLKILKNEVSERYFLEVDGTRYHINSKDPEEVTKRGGVAQQIEQKGIDKKGLTNKLKEVVQ